MISDKLFLKKVDLNFLSNFKRSPTDYFTQKDSLLLEAYQSGIYDILVNYLGEAHLKITGKSQNLEDIEKFLRQASFNGELALSDDNHSLIDTVMAQKALAVRWLKEDNTCYTHLIFMIPEDNDRIKLTTIIKQFLPKAFHKINYAYVEHTDTNIFHYHVIVGKVIDEDSLLQLRSDFLGECFMHKVKFFNK